MSSRRLENLSEEMRSFVAERSTEVRRLERAGGLIGGFVVIQRHRRTVTPPVATLHLHPKASVENRVRSLRCREGESV